MFGIIYIVFGKKKVNCYRILIIDDSERLLELVKWRMQRDSKIQVDGYEVSIDLETVNVQFDEDKNINKDTIEQLGRVCGAPFEYIFTDYGYIHDKSANEEIIKRYKEGKINFKILKKGTKDPHDKESEIGPEYLKKGVKVLADLKHYFENLRDNNKLNWQQVRYINKNFINHKGKTILYTNSPEPFNVLFEGREEDKRIEEVSEVFKKSKSIQLIKMHDEFGITHNILEGVDESERDNHFSSLLASKMDFMLKTAAYRFLVSSQSKLRFDNTKKAFRKLSRIGLIFGVIISFLSATTYSLLVKLYNYVTYEDKTILESFLDFVKFHLENRSNISASDIWQPAVIILLFISLMVLATAQLAKRTEKELGSLINKKK